MKYIKTKFAGVFLIQTQLFVDERGWFTESYLERENPVRFVQDNLVYTKLKNTVRGLHFQREPFSQTKLLRVLKGHLTDVLVDMRKDSPTYGDHLIIEMSEEKNTSVLVPRGFAHGYVTRSDDVLVLYKVDRYYNRESEGAILWSDPTLNIQWNVENPILSEKDAQAKVLDPDNPLYL